MKIIDLRDARKDLQRINKEILYKNCFAQKRFTAGLISFKPMKRSDRKQIKHRDKDVLCHVLRGRGRLRVNRRRILLKPGVLCHIPKGTRHDFAASAKGGLLMFYSLIQTG